jgi:DNA-binding NarL/FixJ family response regulator
MTETIHVIIADDHPIVRQGLELVIDTQPDMALIAKACDGEEAVRLTRETRPDVIVMDLQMPIKDGLTAIKEINQLDLETHILVLTSFPEDEMVIAAVKAGVTGILLKDSPPEKLLEAIRTVYRGESSLHPTVARKLMEEVRQPSKPLPPEDPLTPREIDVLKCLAQGSTNREIALQLDVSVRTVTTHVRNILDKLHLENRTQAALFAVEQGMVPKTGGKNIQN